MYHAFLATLRLSPFNHLLNVRVLETQTLNPLLFFILTLYLNDLTTYHDLIVVCVLSVSVVSDWFCLSLLSSRYIYCLKGILG